METNARDKMILKKLSFYNMTANLVWSIICLAPIFIFCYSLMESKWFYIFLTTSTFGLFLPKTFFQKMHIAKTSRTYQKLGIKFIKKFTQNGDIINKLMRKKYPDYQMISRKKVSINRFISQSFMFEKFHFIVFSFFLFATVYALVYQYFWWAAIIMVTNIIYNIYPILLQQYFRIKILSFSERNQTVI